MAGALRLIRNEFGENAVILSAKSLKKEKGLFGAVRNVGVEVTAAKDALPESSGITSATDVKDVYTRSGQGAYPVRKVVNAGRNFTPAMETEAANHIKKAPGPYSGIGSLTGRLMSVKKDLIEGGVENNTATMLIDAMTEHTKIKDNLEDEELRSGLLRALEKSGFRGAAIQGSHEKQKIAVLVGGPGDGKTETIAKLAATHLRADQHRVAFVSLDCHRVAANAQLKTYARIFGLPFSAASNASQLVKAIADFKEMALILVDTPGLTEENRDNLLQTLKTAGTDCRMDIFPVVNALTREDISIQMIRNVQSLSPGGVVFSNIDNCKPLGAILNVILSAGLPVCHYSCGQRVPEDLGNDCLEMLVNGMFSEKKAYPKKPDHVRLLDNRVKDKVVKTTLAAKGYVASVNSDVFHVSDCKLAEKIKEKNLVKLKDMLEAKKKRLIPCGFCMAKPPE